MLANGNFGVGTTTPAYKLHVNGKSRFENRMGWSGGSRTSYAGHSTNRDWYIRSGSKAGKVVIQDGGGNVGKGYASPAYDVRVSGGLFGRHLLYGGDADSGVAPARLRMKTRDELGHPDISFQVYAPTFLGWIPFTFTVYGSGVYSNGGSHFHRVTYGHGSCYNGSNSTTGMCGVAFTTIYFINILQEEIGIQITPIPIWEDNKGARSIANHSSVSMQNRHIMRRYHHVRQAIRDELFIL